MAARPLSSLPRVDSEEAFRDPCLTVHEEDVLQDRAFWAVIIWLMMVPGFTITGLFFHQIHIASEKGIPLITWSSNYIWYALAAVCGALISGILVDRFSAHRVAVVAQIPMVLACLVLMMSDSFIMLALFFALFGWMNPAILHKRSRSQKAAFSQA